MPPPLQSHDDGNVDDGDGTQYASRVIILVKSIPFRPYSCIIVCCCFCCCFLHKVPFEYLRLCEIIDESKRVP